MIVYKERTVFVNSIGCYFVFRKLYKNRTFVYNEALIWDRTSFD